MPQVSWVQPLAALRVCVCVCVGSGSVPSCMLAYIMNLKANMACSMAYMAVQCVGPAHHVTCPLTKADQSLVQLVTHRIVHCQPPSPAVLLPLRGGRPALSGPPAFPA
eukprot:scaffold24380_cov18-Tisochrysis_lutea.AAC.2